MSGSRRSPPRTPDQESEAEGTIISSLLAQLDELRARYEDLLHHNMAGVFLTTATGRILDCNENMARIMGYASREEVLALPAVNLYLDPGDRESYMRMLRRDGFLKDHTIVLRHKTGRPVHVLENVRLYQRADGSEIIQGTMIDQTPLVQAEMEQRTLLENYRLLVEQVRDGILIVRDGVVRFSNPAADAYGGRALTGVRPAEVVHPDDQRALQEVLDRSMTIGSDGPREIRFSARPGAWLGLMVSGHRALHQGLEAVHLSLHDPAAERALLEERTRARLAEEVNEVLRDEILEHRRTQEALKQSRRFARSLVDSSLDMIMAADPQGRVTEFNPAATMRFGYEIDEVMGRDTRMLYADEGEYLRVQHELNDHGAFAGEIRNISKDGRIFTTFLAASRLYDEDGGLIGAMGVSRDITQAKRDQEALRASEERFRDLFDNAMDLIQSVDQEGRFEYVNRAWCETLGRTVEEVNGLRIVDIIAPEERDHYLALRARVFETGESQRVESVFIRPDGTRVLVEGILTLRNVEGLPLATRGTFRDMTSEKQARQEVERWTAKVRALFESSEHMFWTVDDRLALTSFNRSYAAMVERLHGTTPELNLDREQPRRLFAQEDHHAFWATKYQSAFAGRPQQFETDLVDQQGRRVCNEIFLSPVFDAQGEVKEVFGVGHEITEKKVAEDVVRDQAARLKAIFENAANVMIWTLDREFRITAFNTHFADQVREAFGFAPQRGDAFMDHLRPLLDEQDHDRARAHYLRVLKGKPQQLELKLTAVDGSIRWVEIFLNPIHVDGQVQEVSCLAYGITEKKEAEQRLRESLHEKEILLKEVHHRVKNNLQVINSILNLQTSYVGRDQRMLDLLRESQDRIRSMSFIHESLYQNKTFSSVDLAGYMERLARNLVMSYSIHGKVELITELDRVEVVLDQAIPCGLILNELISNALKHGFPDGREGHIRLRLRMDGDQVAVLVQDDGVGLPEQFEPGRDANLGLQLVLMLTDQLDGRLERVPGPGAGYFLTFERIK